MPGKPFDWNTVVTGAWNLAILTPNGISRRLFNLDPGTPVEVQVSIDRQAPIRVIHSNLMVVPSSGRLVVAPTEASPESLKLASTVAIRAIESLPETPMTAAGVNLRYQFDALPEEMIELLNSSIDDRLSQGDHRITARSIKRSVSWNDGVLNLDLRMAENASGVLELNFHLQSKKEEQLRAWLARTGEMIATAKNLLSTTFRITIKETTDE